MNDLRAAIEEIATRAARETIERLESRIQFLEARLAGFERQPELLTEKEAAAMLRVGLRTLQYWRADKLIPFIQYTGGDIRYRRKDVESYLQGRERGGKRAMLKAA